MDVELGYTRRDKEDRGYATSVADVQLCRSSRRGWWFAEAICRKCQRYCFEIVQKCFPRTFRKSAPRPGLLHRQVFEDGSDTCHRTSTKDIYARIISAFLGSRFRDRGILSALTREALELMGGSGRNQSTTAYQRGLVKDTYFPK